MNLILPFILTTMASTVRYVLYDNEFTNIPLENKHKEITATIRNESVDNIEFIPFQTVTSIPTMMGQTKNVLLPNHTCEHLWTIDIYENTFSLTSCKHSTT